jgi:uncharacterized protein (TIGR03435 family)
MTRLWMMTRTNLFLLAAGACAQTTAPTAFEVASIKPHTSSVDFRHMFQFLPGGRFRASNTWIKFVIQQAYDLQDYQVVGGPAWLSSDSRYDIDAKAPGENATKEQMRVMLQTLLVERCQLKVHNETREFAVYNLVAAKGGPKLIPWKEGDPSRPCTRETAEMPCGMHTIGQVADWLKYIVGHPVFDRTGIEGSYDLMLNFDAYEARGQTAPPGYDKPTLTTALPDQLGLRLVATKAQLPVLVIESIQRPSDN